MAETKVDQCRHPGCACPVERGKKYCSDYCEGLSKQPSFACECGHAACAQKKAETPALSAT